MVLGDVGYSTECIDEYPCYFINPIQINEERARQQTAPLSQMLSPVALRITV